MPGKRVEWLRAGAILERGEEESAGLLSNQDHVQSSWRDHQRALISREKRLPVSLPVDFSGRCQASAQCPGRIRKSLTEGWEGQGHSAELIPRAPTPASFSAFLHSPTPSDRRHTLND